MCAVAWLVWLNSSANISSSWSCGSEALALPMSEDCCQNTSASDVCIAAWQEIMKPKAIQLCALLSIQLLTIVGNRMVRSARVHAQNVFLTVQAISVAQRTISMMWKYIRGKCFYCSWSENWQMYLSQNREHPIPPFTSATTFRLYFFSQQHQKLVKRLITNLYLCLIMQRLTWLNEVCKDEYLNGDEQNFTVVREMLHIS